MPYVAPGIRGSRPEGEILVREQFRLPRRVGKSVARLPPSSTNRHMPELFLVPPRARLVSMDQKRVFQDALELPAEARAALAAELIATLDDEIDTDAEAAWSREIRRRLDEVDSGAVRPIPWAEARRRILIAAGRDPNS